MTDIHERIMASIQPQLDRADELLDHYTDGLPKEVWEPLAERFRPAPKPTLSETFARIGAGINNFVDAFVGIFMPPAMSKAFQELERLEILERIKGEAPSDTIFDEPLPPVDGASWQS